MKCRLNVLIAAGAVVMCMCVKQPVTIIVHADNPATMSISLEAGVAYTAAGDKISFKGGNVTFEPPEVRRDAVMAVAPNNYEPAWERWQGWPRQSKAITPKPASAATSLNPYKGLLGGLYYAVDPDNISVTDKSGRKTFRPGTDYVLHPVWGRVGNSANRLGRPGIDSVNVSFTYTLQRIDLVQVTPSGQLLVKKGESAVVCPVRPAADPGCAPLAGVYIATYNQPTVSQADICVINPTPPVRPINKAAVTRTVARLQKGGTVRIAILGASTTHGAEAGLWWDDPSLAYRGRVINGIKKIYPDATIEEIDASQGGITSVAGTDSLHKTVLPAKPDLVTLCFGGNDVAGAVGKPPKVAPEKYRDYLRSMVRAVKDAGAECILVGQYAHHPSRHYAKRVPRYAEICKEVAVEENVGFADIMTAWNNMCTHGIVPYSQLHNNHNHPGVYGHGVMAEVLLEFFK